MQNGHQPLAGPEMPASTKTAFLAGGALWNVDEEVEDVVRHIGAFLTGNGDALQFTADHRPIFFSRELLKTWITAWEVKQKVIETATTRDTETLKLSRR